MVSIKLAIYGPEFLLNTFLTWSWLESSPVSCLLCLKDIVYFSKYSSLQTSFMILCEVLVMNWQICVLWEIYKTFGMNNWYKSFTDCSVLKLGKEPDKVWAVICGLYYVWAVTYLNSLCIHPNKFLQRYSSISI